MIETNIILQLEKLIEEYDSMPSRDPAMDSLINLYVQASSEESGKYYSNTTKEDIADRLFDEGVRTPFTLDQAKSAIAKHLKNIVSNENYTGVIYNTKINLGYLTIILRWKDDKEEDMYFPTNQKRLKLGIKNGMTELHSRCIGFIHIESGAFLQSGGAVNCDVQAATNYASNVFLDRPDKYLLNA